MCVATDTMTEKEVAINKGWIRVQDAGQSKYVKTKTVSSGYESLEKFCLEKELELLTTKPEYIGNGRHRYVFVKPKCGHVFKRAKARLIHSQKCPICFGHGSSRVSDRIHFLAKKYKLVIHNGSELKTKHDLVFGICSLGHEFSREYRHIRDIGCPVCHGVGGYAKATLGGSSGDRKKAVFENILNHCENTKQQCLTDLDKFMQEVGPSAHILIDVKCENNHIRKVGWYTLKQHGCVKCYKESEKLKVKLTTSYASKEDYYRQQRLSTYNIVVNYVASLGGNMATTFEDFENLCIINNIKNSAIKCIYVLDGIEKSIRRGKIPKQ